MESLGQDKGCREELNVSNSYHHPRNWPNPDPGCDPKPFFSLLFIQQLTAHIVQVTLFTLGQGLGDGSKGSLYLWSLSLSHQYSPGSHTEIDPFLMLRGAHIKGQLYKAPEGLQIKQMNQRLNHNGTQIWVPEAVCKDRHPFQRRASLVPWRKQNKTKNTKQKGKNSIFLQDQPSYSGSVYYLFFK